MRQIQHDNVNDAVGEVKVNVPVVVATRIVEDMRPVELRELTALRQHSERGLKLALDLRVSARHLSVVRHKGGVEGSPPLKR